MHFKTFQQHSSNKRHNDTEVDQQRISHTESLNIGPQIHLRASVDWLHWDRIESTWESNLQGHSALSDDLLTNPLQH